MESKSAVNQPAGVVTHDLSDMDLWASIMFLRAHFTDKYCCTVFPTVLPGWGSVGEPKTPPRGLGALQAVWPPWSLRL